MNGITVQAYPEGHPEHDMAKALHGMRRGDKIDIKGPFGSFKYQPGKYKAIGEHLLLLVLQVWGMCSVITLPQLSKTQHLAGCCERE